MWVKEVYKEMNSPSQHCWPFLLVHLEMLWKSRNRLFPSARCPKSFLTGFSARPWPSSMGACTCLEEQLGTFTALTCTSWTSTPGSGSSWSQTTCPVTCQRRGEHLGSLGELLLGNLALVAIPSLPWTHCGLGRKDFGRSHPWFGGQLRTGIGNGRIPYWFGFIGILK